MEKAKYQNMGTFDLGTVGTIGSTSASQGNAMTMLDAAGVASGQAFLESELEKKDMLVRTPLTSFTYSRDIPIRVGGGWVDYVSAMSVGYGISGGSGDNLMHAGGANGIPMVQADFMGLHLERALCGWTCRKATLRGGILKAS